MIGKLSHEQTCQLVRDYESGMGATELARRYSIHPRTVYKIFDRLGIQKRDDLHKLTSEDIATMADEYKSGVMLDVIAERHNIRISTVYYHLAKKCGMKLRARGRGSRRMLAEGTNNSDIVTGSV